MRTAANAGTDAVGAAARAAGDAGAAPRAHVLGSDPKRTDRAMRASTVSSKGNRLPSIS